MKTLNRIIAALVILTPLTSFAQNTQHSLTRAEVRTELVKLEHVGYQPSGNDLYYPRKLQAAEAKVGAAASLQNAYGGGADVVASGRPVSGGGVESHSVYYGH